MEKLPPSNRRKPKVALSEKKHQLFLRLISEELNEETDLIELGKIDVEKHILNFKVGVFSFTCKLSKRNDTIVKHSCKRV